MLENELYSYIGNNNCDNLIFICGCREICCQHSSDLWCWILLFSCKGWWCGIPFEEMCKLPLPISSCLYLMGSILSSSLYFQASSMTEMFKKHIGRALLPLQQFYSAFLRSPFHLLITSHLMQAYLSYFKIYLWLWGLLDKCKSSSILVRP